MAFAILFVLTFLVGVAIYLFTRRWWLAVALPTILFSASILTDNTGWSEQAFSLTFGLPIIFFASLLGAYVVQLRSIEADAEETADPTDDQQ